MSSSYDDWLYFCCMMLSIVDWWCYYTVTVWFLSKSSFIFFCSFLLILVLEKGWLCQFLFPWVPFARVMWIFLYFNKDVGWDRANLLLLLLLPNYGNLVVRGVGARKMKPYFVISVNLACFLQGSHEKWFWGCVLELRLDLDLPLPQKCYDVSLGGEAFKHRNLLLSMVLVKKKVWVKI